MNKSDKKKVNVGKLFESDIKASIPSSCLLIRLPDPPQSFGRSESLRFSLKNPCDYICFDTKSKTLWCLELKTTSNKSMSFENIHSDKKETKMIHKHQTLGLLDFSKYDSVIAGFIFNFRRNDDDSEYDEAAYFMEVNSFQRMCDSINKKSFNEKDISTYGAVCINGIKKRTRFIWDIESLFNDYEKFSNN